MFLQMDGKVSIWYNVLERMLLNENEKPTKLPLSLLEAITNNFSNEQEIGRGGFAVVYKGMLGIGKVAVKKLSETLDLLDQKYSREVQCLMKARHKHIVRFLGYCCDTQGEMVDYEGKLVMADLRHRLLCFEFVPGGSLCDYITDASCGLEWRVRYQIIKGICEGLHYLHENRIVHLDLKPANILLDDKMVPKIADFGISRCFDEKQSKDITSKLIGSIGYLAPEYYNGHITMKLDIYSLGVIIIEVLTGAKGYAAIEKVLDNWRNRLELQEGDTPLKQISACTEIGIRCIDPNPDDRPTMQCIMRKIEKLESVYGFVEAGAITSVAHVSFLSDSGKNDGGFVNRTSWPPASPLKRMGTSTKAQFLIQNQKQQQQPSMTQNQQPAVSQSLLLPHQQQQQHQQQKLVHQDGRGRKFVPLSELQQQILLQKQQLPGHETTSDSLGSSSRSCGRHERVEDEETRWKIEGVVRHCSRRLFTDRNNIGKHFFTSNTNDSMCNNPEQSSALNGENFESLISDAVMETARSGRRSPDCFLEDIDPSLEFPRIPYSCPLPIIDSAAKEIGTSSTEAGHNFVGTATKVNKNSNRNQSAMNVTENPPRYSAKFSDRMPDHHIVSGMNQVSRSSSLKESPHARQPSVVPSVDKTGDRSSPNSKGRRSPLRRMLDPILKPRHSSPVRPSFVPECHLPVNTTKQSLDLVGPVPQNVQRRSVDLVVSSNYPIEANINQPPRELLNNARYIQKEKDSATTRQALLQLAWKNGLPLFMLSYGDSDILAATVRRKGISEKDDLESTYAVFTVEEPVEEPKKKCGAWIKAGGKNKKHHLLSSIVGEIKVARRKSRCHHTGDVHVHREFVLVCSEFLPSSEESGDSDVSGGLAAFISALPQQEAETSDQSSSQSTRQRNSAPIGCGCPPLGNFQPSTRNANSASANVIALLPDGFHGTSTSGPSLPLIERWKSGGACDCGGWDEGCMLSVLTDAAQENDAIDQANQAKDGSHRFELLVQGRSREDSHAFSMTSFKQGLYTVEFRSSIALLQAFAMCIVMLHGR